MIGGGGGGVCLWQLSLVSKCVFITGILASPATTHTVLVWVCVPYLGPAVEVILNGGVHESLLQMHAGVYSAWQHQLSGGVNDLSSAWYHQFLPDLPRRPHTRHFVSIFFWPKSMHLNHRTHSIMVSEYDRMFWVNVLFIWSSENTLNTVTNEGLTKFPQTRRIVYVKCLYSWITMAGLSQMHPLHINRCLFPWQRRVSWLYITVCCSLHILYYCEISHTKSCTVQDWVGQ